MEFSNLIKERLNLKSQGHLERVSVDVWKHNLISTPWNGYVTCVVSFVSYSTCYNVLNETKAGTTTVKVFLVA